MSSSYDLQRLLDRQPFSTADRAIRLQWSRQAEATGRLLLPQRISLTEGICQGVTAQVACLTTEARLPLADLIGQPFALQLVTDEGRLRSFPLLLDVVQQGQSDGSVTAVQLVGRDVMAWMNRRCRLRTFRDQSVMDVVEDVLGHWRRSPSLMGVFSFEWLGVFSADLPPRACFVQQPDESDGAFVRRLLAGEGLAWAWRPQQPPGGGDKGAEPPGQQLVMFKSGWSLPAAVSGPVRYHRRDGTERHDTIDLLSPQWRSVPRDVSVDSWNHESARLDSRSLPTLTGRPPSEPHPLFQDARLSPPHIADDDEHLRTLVNRQADHHVFRSRVLTGRGGVRTLAPATHLPIDGYPAFEGQTADERDHIIVSVEHVAENNLPKALHAPSQALLGDDGVPDWARADMQGLKGRQGYTNRFTAVQRGTPIVPLHPLTEVSPPRRLTGIVIGTDSGEILCDELARVKVQLVGGEPGTDTTAWMRVLLPWGGNDHGLISPLRVGTEVVVDWMGPDRPFIAGVHYNGSNAPPRPSRQPSLPDNRNQTALVSREIGGTRQQHLLFDDTPGQLMAQLASEAGDSALSLGELTTPRRAGRAQPRGEGAELRTRAALTARGEQGVFISADELGGDAPALQRAALIGLAETLQSIQKQLSQLAGHHRAGTSDLGKLAAFVQHLKDWENGSSTARSATGGGTPMVAVSAPSTIALGSADNLALAAQTHIDAVSGGNTQVAAGRKLLLHAGEGFSVFARDKGITVVAAVENIEIQAHGGNVHVVAAKQLVLEAGEAIQMRAPTITCTAQGAQVDLGNGQITQQSSGAHVIQSSKFAHQGPGGGSLPGLTLPTSTMQTDEQFVLYNQQNHEPIANRRYRATQDDGQVVEGRSDAQGRTQIHQADAFRLVELIVFPPGQ